MGRRAVIAADCETDPFLNGREPMPFIWGIFDGRNFYTFDTTKEFVDWIINRDIIVYAHNGGKFDFMYLIGFVKKTKAQIINGRIVSMRLGRCELRDSYSIIPEPLKNFGEKKEIEYWKLEKVHRERYREEIVNYLFYDCKSLHTAVVRYRDIAGKQKTIASNALTFAKRLGVNPGRTNHHHDKKFRRFFYGGHCECFRPGTRENVQIIDIHSAYPFAMLNDHATGDHFVLQDDFEDMTREEIQRSFIIIECTSKGAFPKRINNTLCFPHEYDEYHVTGWEYLVAKEFNLISDEKIISVQYTANKITFAPYVNHWYKFKASYNKKTDPVNYTIGKIMQNSLFGKTAQNPANYYDYKIMPAGSPICRELECAACHGEGRITNNDKCKDCDGSGVDKDKAFKHTKERCEKCGELKIDHGWDLEREFEGHEIHVRPSLWKYKYQFRGEWEGRAIYHNVATGASITGFTRAHLMRAMHTVGIEHVIYCDTDGIVFDASADLSVLPFSEAIGDWELEDRSPVGHFAGKKLYAVKLSPQRDKDGKTQYKLAYKGSRLNEVVITRIIHGYETTYLETQDSAAYDKMMQLVNGEIIPWDNPAPTFSIDGKMKFIHRDIRATAKKRATTATLT